VFTLLLIERLPAGWQISLTLMNVIFLTTSRRVVVIRCILMRSLIALPETSVPLIMRITAKTKKAIPSWDGLFGVSFLFEQKLFASVSIVPVANSSYA